MPTRNRLLVNAQKARRANASMVAFNQFYQRLIVSCYVCSACLVAAVILTLPYLLGGK